MNSISRRALLAASAGILWGWRRPDRIAQTDGEDSFRIAPPANHEEAPHFIGAFIGHAEPLGVAHCPSICQLSDGRLATAWYAGSREGAKDVSIWMSRSVNPTNSSGTNTAWEPPRALVDRQSASAELSRYVKKVGNPVIFTDHRDRTWLIYVSIAVGGWSGSSLNVKCSLDGGETWSDSERLVLSPLANLSELVRATPVLMNSGRIAVPIYHESFVKFPELLWLDWKHGKVVWGKTRIAGGTSLLQPTIVPLTPQKAVVYHRDYQRRGTLWQETLDAGQTWSLPATTGLPNPNSSLAGLRLSNGSVLLALNDTSEDRHNLTLAISNNGTSDWQRIVVLENQQRTEFSYPTMIRGRNGFIHLVYTWNRERIRYLEFNEPWLHERRLEAKS